MQIVDKTIWRSKVSDYIKNGEIPQYIRVGAKHLKGIRLLIPYSFEYNIIGFNPITNIVLFKLT